MRVRRAPGMRLGAFLTLVRPAPKLAPPRCSRVRRAVKREAGRVLRTEIANLRCPRNGKRPRRMTQAGSGAFRVQVARGRGPLRVKRAGRRAGTPPARIPAEARSLHGFMTRGLRGSGARSASRDLSSMLTPIVRPAPGARRGVLFAAVAQAAAYTDPSGSATSHVARQAAPRSVARRTDAPLPPEVAVAEPAVLDGDAGATPVDPMGRLPLYCAERRPRERAARRIAGVCAAVWRRLDRRATNRHVARRARPNAESGGRSPHAVSCVDGGESRVRLRVVPEPCAQ
ncbi:hypothetical protein ACVK00_003069 [Burkholderia sp. PvR073]